MTNSQEIARLDESTRENLRSWMEGDFDEQTKEIISQTLNQNPQAIIDAFYTKLSFGTGGMRGIMGIGSARMNPYTVRGATQGLVNYLKQVHKEKDLSVLVGYDSRNNSKEFALETAQTLAANGVKAYLFEDIRPLALISFGCRYKNCDAAVMITASHNPPEYNGYKVFWDDGGQVLPPHDQGIVEHVNQINDLSSVPSAPADHPFIEKVSSEIDEAYLKEIRTLQLLPKQNKESGSSLNIVYTPIHGTGIRMVPKLLEDWGFTNVAFVEQQKEPDGNFPTVKKPNPEEPEAMKMGMDKVLETKSDILIANDPDADRIGVGVRRGEEVVLLNGNQIACLLLDHICRSLKKQNRFPEHACFVKTIVTTELFQAIATSYGAKCFNVLPGFKFIAGLIYEWEKNGSNNQFIFGGEDSYGYLLGTHCRDKDGVISCALACEAALAAKQEGKNLLDHLDELYTTHGVFDEQMVSLQFPESKQGKIDMQNAMKAFRTHPPKECLGTPVRTFYDYQTQEQTDIKTGKTTPFKGFPVSNVLQFWLENDANIIVRPSGTEPKVKLYCGVSSKNTDNLSLAKEHCDTLARDYLAAIQSKIKT